MNKVIYSRRMRPSRYDDNHVLVYLNEMVFENYLPEDADEDAQPYTAYQYTGPMADGGTLIEAKDMERNTLINSVIRSIYSQTEEDAIKTHQLMIIQNPKHEKAEEWKTEWGVFCIERENAIRLVDEWLSE